MLARQSLTVHHKKIAHEIRLQNFVKTLTPRGAQAAQERLWAFEKCPRDPKFIKCTFVPGLGWDLTEREAVQFIQLLDGDIVSTVYQPGLDSIMHEYDANDQIWIGFQ
jgi:hypothetical protein